MKFLSALAAAACVLVCSPSLLAAQETQPKMNVVFILADDMRPDAPHGLGNAQIETPNLDKLAARGCVFTRASCGYPICHVSRSEMLTGRCLVGADMPGHPLKLDPQWVFWPEVMRRAGWHTAYCGKWHVQGTPWTRGYAETAGLFSAGGAAGKPLTFPVSATGRKVTGYTGWTFKDNDNKPLPDLGVGLTPETDSLIANGAIQVIRHHPVGPFFIHVNFTAPHDPLHWPRGLENRIAADTLTLPRNFAPQHPFDHGNINGRDEVIVPAPRSAEDVKKERAIYFTLVENLDAQVGRIVKALEETGELAHTLIIFSSDHGLAMGSHGLMGKQNQYEHTINVPLIIAGPDVPAGRRFTAQCCLRDLFPTVCEMSGLAVPATVQGISFFPVLQGEKEEVRDAVFGYFTDTQRMMRTADGWKLIWYPKISRHQLFHLPDDPDEMKDLSGDPALQDRMQQMQAALEAWQKQQGDLLGK